MYVLLEKHDLVLKHFQDLAPKQHEHNPLKYKIEFRSRPVRNGIADVADALAILVGDESEVGVVVVPVDVPDVVEGDRRGYRLPSRRHRHCPGTAAVGWRRPSGGSSAARDRAAVVRQLGLGLSFTDFPKAGPHYLLWR